MFKQLKSKFKLLEKSGIIEFKNIQNPGVFAFNFYKGIVVYDLKLADRAESGGRKNKAESILNQYIWMTNPIVASRWMTSFSGRLVKIYHRATDLKIEIIGADSLKEF